MRKFGIHKILFVVCFVISAMLLIVSFFIPPVGAITPSALEGASLMFGWGALMQLPEVIKAGKTARIQTGNTSIEITGDEPKKEEEDDI